jgi:lipoprotein NlpI
MLTPISKEFSMRTLLIPLLLLVVLVPSHSADDKPFAAAVKRGNELSLKREHAKAITAYTEALTADPTAVTVQDRRGDAYLKNGQFKEAIADFDAFLKVNPKSAPEHWRRGIALYYAGRHADGVKQFETHKTVNPQDVENAVWHYLCNVKVVGKEKSQATLIDVTKDTRVPMAEIQKLYAGKMTAADVMAAVAQTDPATDAGREAHFYGHLYVALWFEAEGDSKKVFEHITPAVEKYEISHYMWDIAKVHRDWLKAK